MGKLARSVDRGLLTQVHLHLDRLLPAKARETGRDLAVFRNAPGTDVFVAIASLDWVSARGKKDRLRQQATGRGPDAANRAVKALLEKLADPETASRPPAVRPRPVSEAEPPRVRPPPPKPARVPPIDRGLAAAARRLLGYLVPGGATNVRRSVTVAKRGDAGRVFDATATVTWTTAAGRAGTFTASATGDGADPQNVALAYLLAKLERAPIGAAKKRGRRGPPRSLVR